MKKGSDLLRKFGLMTGLLVMIILSVSAQKIRETNGIYYKGNHAYTGSYTLKYDSGKPKIIMNLVNGLKEGEVKVFFANGEVNEIRSYKQNLMDGTWLTFNENKVKVAEAHYTNGKKDGKWFIWDDNGKLIYELEYKDGEKTGTWKNYDKDGKVVSERSYNSNSK